MIEKIISWAVPFACGGVITGLLTCIKTLKRKNNAVEEGVQCLLRAYHAYHKLRGNDVATGLYNKVMALPTEVRE